jgi:hypothetical protein
MILTAQREYQYALEEGADEKAVYEATLAYEYLQKAREEADYSQYGAVERLCKASITWSHAAYTRASGEGMPDVDPTIVPEERAQPTPKPTTEDPEIDIDLDEP